MDKHFLHHLTNNWQHKSLFTLSILGICLISSAFTSGGEKDKPTGKTNTPSSSKEVLRYKPLKPITTYTPNPFYQVTAVPTVATVSPTRNKVNAARNSAVAITFSEAMSAATASSAATKVRGSMQGNLSGTFSGAGTPTATFTPAKSFKAGETVSVSITAAAQNSGGTAIQPHVYSFTAASAVAPATFPDAPKTVSALSFPHGVFVADINGDGTLDIATVNQGSSQVTIRKNDGAGNFTAGTNVSVGLLPESIFMADFDGDGDIDLATANVQGHSVSIRKNDGAGVFTGSTNVDTKIAGELSQSTFVCGADFDGDGDIDLATADAASSAASILMNDGTGNFTISDHVYVAFVPLAVTSADFDNDGDMDLALTSSYLNSVSILDNDGTGSFTFSKEISVGTYPSSIYAADFDGDGLVDIATANRSSNTVSILTNNGGLVFSAGQTFAVGTRPQTVYGGDIDGDGDIDLTTTNSTDNTVSIRLNNGNGGFSGTKEITTTKTEPYALQLADMDGDNTLDIIAVTSAQSSVTIIQNKIPVSTNTAPTISTIANQSTCKGTALAALALTVGDTETAVGSLTVTGTSSNTTLLPNANITFGGTGANRTVTLTPASGQTGTATITLTVTDGGALTATSNFTFTVNNVPSITVTAPAAVCSPATVDLTQLTVTDANNVAGTLTYWKDAAATTAFTTPTAAAAGTYYIKKTATAGGCSDIKSVVVTINAAPTVVAGTAQSICTNAAATQLTGFSPAGGTWSGNGVSASGVFTPTASLVGAQTLTYTAVQNGCSASATKTITVTAAPTVTAGTDETVCANITTLTLAGFSPAGGTWSGTGVTAAGVFSTSAGTQTLTYTVTQSGCTSSATKKVTVAPAITFTLKPTNNTDCIAPNGSIEVVVTSGGTVQYSKDNVTFQTNPIFTGLTAGNYTIYIKSSSCTAQGNITLTDPNAPTAFAVTGGGTGCTGDAGFKVGLTNSQTGVNYQLLRGTTPVGSTMAGTGSTLDFGLQATAGTYTITATNAGSCKSTMTGSATIAFNAIPSITVTAPAAVCSPATVDLTQLTITDANNVAGTLTYWKDAAATTAFTTPTAAPGGTYYIKKTATAGGCSDIKSVVVTVNAAPTVVAGTAQSICTNAAATQLTGFSPAGGTWSGNGVSASGLFTPTASLVGAQTLTYTVTQNGCSASATKTVTVTVAPTVTAGADETVCADANTLTLAGFSPAGGTWSGTGVTAMGVFSTSAGTQTLTYTVTQSGCTSSATKKVTVAPTVAFTLTTTDNTNCLSPNGSIEVVVTSGGTVQYSKDNVTFQTNPIFSGLATGDYTIYVKNESCSAQKTITLAGPDAPTAFAVTGGGTGCTGDAGFKVGLTTSQMGITYQLLQGTTPVGSTMAGTGSALDFGLQAAAGTYTITATNSGNCKNTMTGSVTIAYTAIPSITITAPAAVCAPAAVDLTQLTITDANNADGTFSYWTDATATTAFTNSTAAPAGTYYIKKTTAGGCFDIKSVVVTEKAALVVVAGTAQSVCVDAAAVQLADFSPTGGTWSGNGVSASGVFTPTTSLVGAQTLTYTITQNGCSASATKTVTVTDRPVAPVASANTPTLGGSLNLKASTLANATYQWTGPDNFTSTEQNPVITNVTNAKAGKYTVVATVGGCSSVAGEVTVTVQTIPTVTFSMPTLSAQPATQVVVPVRVKDFTKIASLQGSIRWDKAVATFANVEAFGLAGLTKDNFGGSAQTDAGILTFSWFESTNLSSTLADSTVLFAIRFTIAGNEGTATALSFSDDPTLIEVSNEAAEVIKTLTQPGSIKVVSIVKVAGTVKSANGKAIKDIGLTINDGTTTQKITADATGAYQFTVDSGTSFTVSPFKNNSVSATNGISTLDLILIQRHILGKTLLDSPYKLIAADVNNDKAITTRDILQIRSLILTSATSLPGNRQWAFVRSDFQFNSAAPLQYDSTRVYTQASQVSAQDFIGIRLGDVNDSWDASVARIATAGEVQFSLEDHQALPASEITIPVKVADFNALKGYQFTLNWNPAVLEFKEIQAGGVTATYGVNQAKQGKITTSWQDAQGNSLSLPNDSTAFSIRFKVVGQAGSATNLAINSSLTASEAYNQDLEPLRINAKTSRVEVVTALEEKVYGYVLEQNQPNPFASTTMIGFSLPKEENVNVSIYNSVGQLVSTTTGHYQKGKHQIEWNGIHPNGQKLAPGTYFYRLQAGQFVEVKKAIILE